mmetsp:Transcript_42704/g.76558  ORF Transcript_42704/g.76558 Transcript_42704/m.76558 type:complete len:172 (+) Transcript_42704:1968-2483(+)
MGSGIPFVMYFIWELVILGTIPPGVSLTSANQIIEQIGAASGDTAIIAVKVFSAFAIITSFLGVGLGCIDFIQVRPTSQSLSPVFLFMRVIISTLPSFSTAGPAHEGKRPLRGSGLWRLHACTAGSTVVHHDTPSPRGVRRPPHILRSSGIQWCIPADPVWYPAGVDGLER